MHGENPIRIYTFVGKAKQVEFAADVVLTAISYIEQLLDISYTLPKLDFVTIHNFTMGGMENWGLITILADAIIFEKNETSFKNIRRSVDVVSHEIAHQWTGNLVTMSLWSKI
ncbi:glutamyl aminopeptidase-like protein [Dinothrombium tinctorium]|uniref:Glutamyl aminopeptidase-like protein n=1 Tax=Dinothrombium tinctorium TaxID=1965070 RepID=A0A443QAG1_9ACAR|nr:glutamyl aminopeptidase-like protein [Dinothrombium tinctorium]